MLIRNLLYRNLATRVPYRTTKEKPEPLAFVMVDPAVVGERRGFCRQAIVATLARDTVGLSPEYRSPVADAAENRILAWAEEQSLALLFLIRSTWRVYLSAPLVHTGTVE